MWYSGTGFGTGQWVGKDSEYLNRRQAAMMSNPNSMTDSGYMQPKKEEDSFSGGNLRSLKRKAKRGMGIRATWR